MLLAVLTKQRASLTNVYKKGKSTGDIALQKKKYWGTEHIT
jgi:hypothetical protein